MAFIFPMSLHNVTPFPLLNHQLGQSTTRKERALFALTFWPFSDTNSSFPPCPTLGRKSRGEKAIHHACAQFILYERSLIAFAIWQTIFGDRTPLCTTPRPASSIAGFVCIYPWVIALFLSQKPSCIFAQLQSDVHFGVPLIFIPGRKKNFLLVIPPRNGIESISESGLCIDA